MSVARYVLSLKDELSGPLKEAAGNVHKASASLEKLSEKAKRLDADSRAVSDRFGRISVSADGASASIGDLELSASRLRSEAGKVESETRKLTAGWDKAADALDKLAQSSDLTAEQQKALAKRSLQVREEATRLNAEAKEQAAILRRVADATEAKARADKAAAAEAKAEERAIAGLNRELEKQRRADERVRLGKEQAQAVQELRAIDELKRELRARNKLEQDGLELLERRERQIRENLAIETGSLARRGVRFDRGMGARGTRRSPAGGGVFSTRMDEFAASVNRLEDSAGDADSIIMALSGALGQISPEAETAGRAIGDVAASLEAFARIAAGKGAAVLGALAIAAGTAATAYLVYKNATESADESQGRLNAAIEEGRTRLDKYREEVAKTVAGVRELNKTEADLRRDLAVITGELTQEEADLAAERARLTEQARPGILAARRQSIEAERQIKLLKERLVREREVGETAARTRKQITRLEQERDRAASEAIKREQQLQRAIDLTELRGFAGDGAPGGEPPAGTLPAGDDDDAAARAETVAAAVERIGDVEQRLTDRRLTGADAINAKYNEQIAQIQETIDALGELSDAEAAVTAAAAKRAQQEIEAARAQELAAERTRQILEEIEQRQAIRAAGRVTEELSEFELQQLLERGEAAVSAQPAAEAEQPRAGGGMAGGIATAGAIGSGDVVGAIGAIDPMAGAIAGAMQAIGSGQAGAMADESVDLIVDAIGELPTIIAEVIPDVILRLGTELPKALAASAGDIAAAIAVDLPVALIESAPEIFAALIEALLTIPDEIVTGIGNALREALGLRPVDDDRGFFERLGQIDDRDAQQFMQRQREEDRRRQSGRSFRSGTSLVQSDGSYSLHRGEAVISTSGQASQAVRETLRRSAPDAAGPRVRPVTMEALVLRLDASTGPYGRLMGVR